ncbi:MAG: GNAT family N-acetyltransferase [Gemmatimonadales bacterium]
MAVAAEVVPFPDCFDTARLRAERLTAEHYDAIRAMDSDAEYMALLGGPRDMAETLGYMARNLQHWADHGFGLWVLRDAADGRVAGRCVLRHLDVEGTDEVELGYGFHKEYWGRGLATEVARTLLQFGLKELKLPSIVAITRPANLGSQRVLIKTGFAYEREVSYDGVPHVLYRSTQRYTP